MSGLGMQTMPAIFPKGACNFTEESKGESLLI